MSTVTEKKLIFKKLNKYIGGQLVNDAIAQWDSYPTHTQQVLYFIFSVSNGVGL